jgi:hypothetical protein
MALGELKRSSGEALVGDEGFRDDYEKTAGWVPFDSTAKFLRVL